MLRSGREEETGTNQEGKLCGEVVKWVRIAGTLHSAGRPIPVQPIQRMDARVMR